MALQYINDSNGKPTGVFIPIKDWKKLTKKYSELELEDLSANIELQDWQKKIIDERLSDYKNNPQNTISFSELMKTVRKSI